MLSSLVSFQFTSYTQQVDAFVWRSFERVGFPDRKAGLGEARGDNARARIEYELKRLRDPATGEVPPNIRERELAKSTNDAR